MTFTVVHINEVGVGALGLGIAEAAETGFDGLPKQVLQFGFVLRSEWGDLVQIKRLSFISELGFKGG